MEMIGQCHRVAAARKVKGENAMAIAMRGEILAGKADGQPFVKAAAFRQTA